MNSYNRNRSVPFFRYFPRAIKFYGLKIEKIAALVFIALLAINLTASLFTTKIFDNVTLSTNDILNSDVAKTMSFFIRVMVLSLFSFLISNVASSFYVYAYIKDLRGIPYTFGECTKIILGKLIKIFILSIITALAIILGAFVAIIPGSLLYIIFPPALQLYMFIGVIPVAILYIMFIFAIQFMVDQNRTVFNSLKASIDLTSGYKVGIFSSILILNIITMLVPSFVESSSGILVFSFVSAFITTIFSLIYQRFITLMYFDLEYIRKPRENSEEETSEE